jgi:hypothetical protein
MAPLFFGFTGNNPALRMFVYMAMKKCILFLLGLGSIVQTTRGQSGLTRDIRTEIAFYADVMVNAVADQHRMRAYDEMTRAMDSLLAKPGSMDISLDSIPWLSVLKGDGFRVVTWQWKVNAEEYKYGGFIQTHDKLTRLKDSRPFINGSAFHVYTPAAWYGGLYYGIIPFSCDGKNYSVLLGFNAENSLVNTKVADILDLTGDEPRFGVPLFEGKGEAMTRILLTYSDLSTVHIAYDSVFGGIVHDHLESLAGVGPNGESMPVSDGSLEGWVLKEGKWQYVEEAFDVPVAEPPMTDDRKERKEDKDILGRPRKQ